MIALLALLACGAPEVAADRVQAPDEAPASAEATPAATPEAAAVEDLTAPCDAAEDFLVDTDDGARVALHHHPGQGPPVIVVHGISSNHHCWDLTARRSLAVALVDAGFDPWLLDLRGHGDATTDAEGRKQRVGWKIDDYGRHDVPAAVAFVLERTGAERVGYVGHSLGGMVGAIYAGTVPGAQDHLSALVAVGSPMDFTDPDPLVVASLTAARSPLPVVPTDLGARLKADLNGSVAPVDRLVDLIFVNAMAPEVRQVMYRRVVSPMTRGELQQLARVLEAATFTDAEAAVDYQGALAHVTVPTLVIAGRADRIAPVDRVAAYHRAVGAEDKRFVIVGRATGFTADYGHMDLTMGDAVADEVYPLIIDWLRR